MARMLYYDRDPAWCERAARYFSSSDAGEVTVADTFEAAVAHLREAEFDAVVADPPEDELLALLSFVQLFRSHVPFILFMEPGHEALVIEAMNSGADRFIGKRGEPQVRFEAVSRTVEMLLQGREQNVSLQRRNEDLEFLSRIAMDFVSMEDDVDIYRVIADRVQGLVPGSIVVLNLFEPATRLITLHTMVPEALTGPVVREELGHDLIGLTFPLDASAAAGTMLESNRVIEGMTSLYLGTMKVLPEEACRRIEERLDVGKYYSMGFTCREGLYGNITVVTRKGLEFERRELVEAFIRQASVALLRHHVRLNLKESEARYRAVVESQQELICRFRPDGTHLVANEAYCRFFSLDPERILGGRFMPDVPVEDRGALDRYFQGFSRENPKGAIEHRVILPDGRVRWLQWQDRAFFDRTGALAEFQSVGRDVTERKEAEEALAALTAELERRVEERTAELKSANRDLESFTYTVSHDLRSPLRAIDGYAHILAHEHQPELTGSAIRYLEQIGKNARGMARLIDDLLVFSRTGRQALAIQDIDPALLVAEVLDDLAGERQGREVRVTVGGLAPCRADPVLLKQVFANLVGNALKFTRNRELAEIAIGSSDGDGCPVYSVRDNGVGFDQKYANMLFQVFHRLHSVHDYEGTGVGLAIVQRIVERHGGRCWAEGEPEAGAEFFFTLGSAPA